MGRHNLCLYVCMCESRKTERMYRCRCRLCLEFNKNDCDCQTSSSSSSCGICNTIFANKGLFAIKHTLIQTHAYMHCE